MVTIKAAALSFCGEIQETELTDLNVDLYLQKMEAEENREINLLISWMIIKRLWKVKVFEPSVFRRMIFAPHLDR